MSSNDHPTRSRRQFMHALAALPALLGSRARAHGKTSPLSSGHAQNVAVDQVTVDQVLNVAEFEALAQAKLPPAHFGYIATGVDDDLTVALNHTAYSHIEIRARRFADVSKLDTTRTILGDTWPVPFYFSAVSGMRAFHPDAELGVARAAQTKNIQMMASTVASSAIEDIVAARKAPVWQQLYATDDWNVTLGIVKRAHNAGSPAIVLTVDSLPGRNNETLKRAMRRDARDCNLCHVNGSHDQVHKAPMFEGLDVSKVSELSPTSMSEAFLARLRAAVSVRLLVKGIVTAEDALIALKHGVDGIVVSNHGGRNEETLRPTIECVPEIVAAVQGRIPVFVDGGIRRGTDIFKALGMGATAVGIGRPTAWGLAAFGQPGVEAVSTLLTRELQMIMRQAGTPSLNAIDSAHLIASRF